MAMRIVDTANNEGAESPATNRPARKPPRPKVGFEEWVVAEGREAYAAKLEEVCRTMDLLRRGRPHLRKLSTELLGSPSSLRHTIETLAIPRLDTLRALARGTGVPLEEWLVLLRVLPPYTPQSGDMSAAQRMLIEATLDFSDDQIQGVTELLRRLRNRHEE